MLDDAYIKLAKERANRCLDANSNYVRMLSKNVLDLAAEIERLKNKMSENKNSDFIACL